ncbi:MAG TPA: hypothetical protein PLY61_16465 [Anaerohalosphaeraceae bacterium]|nr:hypothetical protein [Anaerohalosphaeraceae bacterium]
MNGINIIGFVLEFGFVAVIVLLQFWFFGANARKRRQLKRIFPKDINAHLSTAKDFEGVTQIDVHDVESEIFREEIIGPINSYLEKNKGATDYHIIKDLSDRACDKIQDEVDSYNPIPLYLGLCGTMLGIIFGIVFLWLGGGLDSLLASASSTGTVSGDSASQGIQHLLGGVAVAMIASLFGVVLTIIGTHQTKDAVAANETGRNQFLSWIQSSLLPKMSGDVVSTLGVFYSNLNEFNGTFAQNSKELKSAFQSIKEAYKGQTEYTKELNKLDIAKAQMAFAALGSATDKINDLNEFLKGSNVYLANVVALADKLDTADARTKAIERMGQFFQSEIEQISARKAILSQTVGEIDLNLQKSLAGLQESTNTEVAKLQDHLNKVYLDFQKAVEEQQDLLEKKLTESSLYLEQFKRLETIEGQLAKLLTAEEFAGKADSEIAKLDTQIGRLDRIEAAINRLAEILSKRPASAAQGVREATLFDNPQQPQDVKVKVNLPVPRWLAFTTCGVLIAAGLFSIIYPLLIKFLG